MARKQAAVDDGEALWKRADALGNTKRANAKAVVLYARAYRLGCTGVAFNLAATYQNDGAWKQAVRWFRVAAKDGDRKAEIELAQAQLFGRGMKQDIAAAVRSLERLAAMRVRRAVEDFRAEPMVMLATMYLSGWPVPRDYRRGMRWLRRAAKLDYDPAIGMLAWYGS